MAINADYATPVTVNGYSCKNCTDVDYAKKHIDPAHPKDGPYGIDARNNPTSKTSPAVILDGRLAGLNSSASSPSAPSTTPTARLDISV